MKEREKGYFQKTKKKLVTRYKKIITTILPIWRHGVRILQTTLIINKKLFK